MSEPFDNYGPEEKLSSIREWLKGVIVISDIDDDLISVVDIFEKEVKRDLLDKIDVVRNDVGINDFEEDMIMKMDEFLKQTRKAL